MPRGLLPGIKRLGVESDHSLVSNIEIKNAHSGTVDDCQKEGSCS